MQPHSPKSPLREVSRPSSPVRISRASLKSRTLESRASPQISTTRVSHECFASPQISRPSGLPHPFNSHALSGLALPFKPHDSLRPSNPESRAPLQIPRPLMPLGSSALPQISRPLEVLGSRKPMQISWPLECARDPHAGQPAPTCPRDARQRWGPRKPRGRGVPPPAPRLTSRGPGCRRARPSPCPPWCTCCSKPPPPPGPTPVRRHRWRRLP